MEKLKRLKEIIKSYESALVAFSGGVDSALVLKVSRLVLGKSRVKAVTAQSASVAQRELKVAVRFAREHDVNHEVIETREMENAQYRSNPRERCYFCKTELYDRLLPMAHASKLGTICNGTNADDLHDFRPGLAAASEHQVKSPLVEAGLNKEDVRALSRELGLEVWDKPESPCLSSRIPYGEEVTAEKLGQIEAGENFLKDLGFRNVRMRHFGRKARVELGREEFIRVMDVSLRNHITEHILRLGFQTVYFEPYKSGRLNEEGNRRHPSSLRSG